MGKSHKTLREALAKHDALDVLHACIYPEQSKLFTFVKMNSSKRKNYDDTLRAVPTRIGQKSTARLSDDAKGIFPESASDIRVVGAGATKGATARFKGARAEGGADYAALLLNALLPSEVALAAAVLAQQDDVDWSTIDDEHDDVIEELVQSIAKLAHTLLQADAEELPDGSKPAKDYGGRGVPEDYAQSIVSRFDSKRKGKAGKGKEASKKTEEYIKADVDELKQIKYIGESTARSLLGAGWTWDHLKKQSALHGKEAILEAISDIVSKQALQELEARLPDQV